MKILTTFRFQTGSIKSLMRDNDVDFFSQFRFQTGSIKRSDTREQENRYGCCFDSKLVRLKDNDDTRRYCWRILFRFQTGSIKSATREGSVPVDAGFDSKLVRLKETKDLKRCVSVRGFDSKLVRLKDS